MWKDFGFELLELLLLLPYVKISKYYLPISPCLVIGAEWIFKISILPCSFGRSISTKENYCDLIFQVFQKENLRGDWYFSALQSNTTFRFSSLVYSLCAKLCFSGTWEDWWRLLVHGKTPAVWFCIRSRTCIRTQRFAQGP